MAKNTAGPWNTHLCDDTLIVDGDGNSIAEVAGNYSDPDEWPAMEANARLIAAAPDLLEALKDLRSVVIRDDPIAWFGSSCMRRVEEAIAKAEGH